MYVLYIHVLFAADWKKAFLSPIPKGQDVRKASDLRPIALLSCIGKLMERAVLPLFRHSFDQLGVIPAHQAAFRRNRSTQEHLTTFTQAITGMHRDQVTVALLLDVSKAFNSVWHECLLAKLAAAGLPDHMLRFLGSWLADRQYATRIDNTVSTFREHTRGVPQGSVLSPLMFNAYFSTVLQDVVGIPLLYADDAAILLTVDKSQLTSALQTMQNNASLVDDWCAAHAFRMNASKCKLLVFSRNRLIQQKSKQGVYHIHIQGMPVCSSASARYLGVWFDPAMTFVDHCHRIITKCALRAGSILRLGGYLWGCPPQHMIKLFQATVTSVIDYFSAPFLLASPVHTLRLAKLQHSFLKRALSLPRCGGGLTAEVYARVLPADLQLRFSFSRMMARLSHTVPSINASVTACAFSEFTASCPAAVMLRKRHKSICSLYIALLAVMDVPFYNDAASSVPASPPLISLPHMPSFNKHRSAWHLRQAQDFAHSTVASIPATDDVLYTDGSYAPSTRIGGSAVHISSPNEPTATISQQLIGPGASPYSAEVLALVLALRHVLVTRRRSTIVCDSQAIVRALFSTGGSIHLREARAAVHDLQDLITILWIPSHTGVHGNDSADFAAAQAAQLDFDGVTVAAPYSYVEFTKCIKSRSWEIFNARWVSSSNSAPLHALFDRVPFNRRHIVGDPSTARQMARLRCGYTSSNEFLHRHGLAQANTCDYCRLHLNVTVLDTTTHAFCECPRHAYHNTTFMCAVADLLPSGFQFLDVIRPPRHESLALRLSSLIISHASKISAHYCF